MVSSSQIENVEPSQTSSIRANDPENLFAQAVSLIPAHEYLVEEIDETTIAHFYREDDPNELMNAEGLFEELAKGKFERIENYVYGPKQHFLVMSKDLKVLAILSHTLKSDVFMLKKADGERTRARIIDGPNSPEDIQIKSNRIVLFLFENYPALRNR